MQIMKPIRARVKASHTEPDRKVSIQSLLVPLLLEGLGAKKWEKTTAKLGRRHIDWKERGYFIELMGNAKTQA